MIHLIVATTMLFEQFDHATVSAYAIRASTGEVLLDERSDASLYPASCMKLVATAAALQLLGPDAHFQTDLAYDGTLDDSGTLHGNLIIRGGGDPCLGSDRITPSLSWDQQLEAWAQATETLGIRRIEGKVIGDASKWEKALAVPSWLWEDLGNYYGAGACALSFHENSYALFFQPTTLGQAAPILRTVPPTPTLNLLNEVTTGPVGSGDRACIYGSEFSPIQCVRGTIPAGVPEFFIKGAIPNPPQFCADALSSHLQSKGIPIQNQPIAPSQPHTFHTTTSPSLQKIIHDTNRYSINLYTEHLVKKIGEKIKGEGSTTAGTEAITAYWRSQHINLSGFQMADGSGLSRKNLITAKQLVAILLNMKQSEHYTLFLNSLPQKGEKMRAKSGSMSLARAYAGYCDDIIFAILINQCLDPDINKKIERILEKIQAATF